MLTLEEVKSLLSTQKKIVITTHYHPDGDAMGSTLGLWHYLKSKGHDAVVITPTDYPDYYKWMPGDAEVKIYTQNKPACRELVAQAEIIFCLDFNSMSRLQEFGKHTEASSAKKILIDHHLEPERFPDFMHWRTEASSTSELIVEFIDLLGDKSMISKESADCLYAGILTDTGSFQHSIYSPNVFHIVADLVERGADAKKVYDKIYNSYTPDRLTFFGFCLTERMKLFSELRCSVMSISLADQEKYHIELGDTEGLVNYPLKMKGFIFSALIIDRKEVRKISLRSKGDVDVNRFLREHFNGGGHKNAAGANTNMSLEETTEKLINLLPQYTNQLNQQQ